MTRPEQQSGGLVACEASCEPHYGEVVRVNVQKWGAFDYCAAAIAEDRRRGLTVEIVEPRP